MVYYIKKFKLVLLTLIIFPLQVKATSHKYVNTGDCKVDVNDVFPTCIEKKTIPEFIALIINSLIMLGGVIAVLFLILGGVQYVTSAGNPDSIGRAKNTIIYAIIGLVVSILGYSIVKYIIGSF